MSSSEFLKAASCLERVARDTLWILHTPFNEFFWSGDMDSYRKTNPGVNMGEEERVDTKYFFLWGSGPNLVHAFFIPRKQIMSWFYIEKQTLVAKLEKIKRKQISGNAGYSASIMILFIQFVLFFFNSTFCVWVRSELWQSDNYVDFHPADFDSIPNGTISLLRFFPLT